MTAFFERPGPRWFNIPAHRPFAQDLARGLHEALAPLGPEALSQAIVLTPTRRGARALADAFVTAADGRAVLPPQMRPLGDLDEGEPPFEPGDLALDLPAAIEPLRRRFELTRMVVELADLVPGGVGSASGALDLADALGGFFDGLQIEEASVAGGLAGLVAGELAEHWEVSRAFLEQALVLWPARLESLGVVDVSERRVRLLRRLAEAWTTAPPKGVLVAAGSTGTAPATRALLIAIASAPQGAVVLPGLDLDLDDKAWGKADVQHPQGALKRLLDAGRVARSEVETWPASKAERPQERWRRRIVNEALRPAEETADWLHVIGKLKAEREDAVAEGLRGLSLVNARTEEEAATAAALLLREALETPDRTAALVTPDLVLARRVTAKLARWGVVPDSSAGESLAGSRCGTLAALAARAAVDPIDPVVLLGLLKHPFSRLGDATAFEQWALRGPRRRTWDEIRDRLERAPSALPLAARLEAIVTNLDWTGGADSPALAARRTVEAMEAIAADASGDTGALWAGNGGEAMSRLLGGIIDAGDRLPDVSPRQFADLLKRLMDGETIRSGGATHPRLRILGSIEARLVRADRLVVAGLEEGVWPAAAPTDPFLSRPMREALGLPSPERRIGLAAHDFAQAVCAPEVILLHTERRDGAPSVKSRWLWRLETLARGAGLEIPGRTEVLDWANALDAPGGYEPVTRPSPRPPVAERPGKLFVTRIETLTRDPYAVWARDILKLRVLERPDEEVEARARGTAIHAAFERFVLDHPDALPADTAAIFKGLYLEELERAGMPRDALARETALATEASAWVADLEARRRADGRTLHVEKEGEITLEIAGLPFTLAAKADRIEVGPDGLGHVLDYKTGRAPSKQMVLTGFSPQLTLTAAIMARGGFAEIGQVEPGDLTYLEVTGRHPPGREEVRASPSGDNDKVLNSRDATDRALAGMVRLIERYADPAQGYTSRTAPQFVKLYVSDYDHLARVFEWSTSGEDEDAMSLFDLVTERDAQEEAADPTLSAFVSANAGSGKTKTLIDRVARLLLAKAKPETILCVTYTKAAASEMQRRLFQVLGGWSVASDVELRKALGLLRSRAPASFDAQDLSEARSLFAAALETPGGLKIQTIHAFCEKVLRRFPLEAGVPPGFRVMDEPAAAAVAAAARRMVAHHVLATPGDLADAYGRLAVALDFRRFQAMFAEFEARRGQLAAFLDREGGLEGAKAWVWRAVDIARDTDPFDLAVEAMGALDRALYRRAAEALKDGGKTDAARAATLARLAASAEPAFDDAVALFFTNDGEPRKWISSTKRLKDDPTLQSLLLCEQARLEEARARMRAAQVGRDSIDALSLADAYLKAYAIEKDAAGALDFADLVDKTGHLLRDRPAAQWVLFKLDGGVDHILLDEAQDTAPDQWKIIDALTDEFFSGEGRREAQLLKRAMFVVGDEKQSIYSFQGARPELLRQKYEFHKDRATRAGFRLKRVDLLTSWRSTQQVLSFVDKVFAPPSLAVAIQSAETPEPVRHAVSEPRRDHAGCVDIWDLEVERKGKERDAWDLPLDIELEDSANRKLARRIAGEIRALIDRGDGVYEKGVLRPAHAGDILILVRRRGALFEEILRALKRAEVPVAGADRLTLSGHIIFDDLLALARFALFPGDELTLAALLKSPFCGLDDDSLYALAHGRDREGLWTRLRRRAAEDPRWSEAAAFLGEVVEAGRTARPFEFYVRLTEHVGADGFSMRRRLLHRLGGEARDALDEFLNQVLAAEARGAHDLETLADELVGLEIVVKREMEAVREEVRVMTAHGAKGLEAPIVFLPETTLTQTQRPPPLLSVDRGAEGQGFLWCPRAASDCPATAEARAARNAREDAEAYRLLYVALTRARDRLVLCGRRAERTDPDKIRGWWGAIREALADSGIKDAVRELKDSGGKFRRYGDDPVPARARAAARQAKAALPAWTQAPVAIEAFARYASPSDLGEGAAVASPSPLSAAGGLGRFRRGDLIHRLLQVLPDLAAEARAEGARSMLARERDLTEAQRAEMTAAAISVLEDPRFAEVFGPGSRAEVAIAGSAARLPPGLKISGRIDRLVVLPDRVLVADFKTNRPSPTRIEDADPAYLRQMAIYAAVLGEVFPDRPIEAALVWTDGPKLMPIPEKLIGQSLAELGR